MKKRLLFLAVLILGAFLIAVEGITHISIRNAECSWCYTGPCYSSSICGLNCVCVKDEPYEVQGYCAHIGSR